MLPTTQFAYWKGLGTCDVLLCVSHTLQGALESGQSPILLASVLKCVDGNVNDKF